MRNRFFIPFTALALALVLSLPVMADTIRLKDGSVIRGQVIGFKDQQFTILVGAGARGRRSRVTIYMEDVESIEFDSATSAAVATITNDDTGQSGNNTVPVIQSSRPQQSDTSQTGRINTTPQQTSSQTSQTAGPTFQINTRVRGDNTANGWTYTGLAVRRGQRLRISATGRIMLGGGRYSTPAGLSTLPDREKLMRNEPTGALIAVIGDDNDDFIFIGSRREFTAQRDGMLFLGVNEGNLNDNTGAYDAVVEAEAIR